ncbi:Protein kinase domain [Castilleja foliolosa]|uniref:Protein kinase domain n=1 Tax=Castilleja foliolosa TaxID=1961234 RepID=A0ABD3EEE4_9LAMI
MGDVLIAFKENLDDPNNVLQSWDPNFPDLYCTWYHVTCNAASSVTRLNFLVCFERILSNNSITGNIPKEIGSGLTNLVELDLSYNFLNGTFPTTLSKLTNLKSLILKRNAIFDNIPKDLGDLANLENLDLSTNAFRGEIPNSLRFLRNLKTMCVAEFIICNNVLKIVQLVRVLAPQWLTEASWSEQLGGKIAQRVLSDYLSELTD